jgi:hypothetical protein
VADALIERRHVREVCIVDGRLRCRFADGADQDLPIILGRYLRAGDELQFAGTGSEILVDRPGGHVKKQLLHATIGYVAQPKPVKSGEQFVRAELPNCAGGLKALFINGLAIRRHFYLLEVDPPQSLYRLLQAPETASPDQLRLAWRTRTLELRVQGAGAREESRVERAFNVLANPDLRACYDALCKDDEAPPLFPYGGFGSILVEGRLADDAVAFFAERIVAYKPDMTKRKVSLLLRQCEFLADRVVCRDPRRKLEVWLDANLLPGLHWDLTWNHWKHWLQSRIKVEATFVNSGKYRLVRGEWVFSQWHAALPSRLQVRRPDSLWEDIESARAIHALLGEHADLVRHIRAQCEREPVESGQVQAWFDQVHASGLLKPQHVNWRPDYDPYYFEQLRDRAHTWFLFRDEYLCVWKNVLIAEMPKAGHATYVFTRPADVKVFLERYRTLTREDIRRNRDNLSSAIGFVGRVVRGGLRRRWLAEVLDLAGEKLT